VLVSAAECPAADFPEARMTELLEKAIRELRELSAPEQDVLAEFIASVVAERKFDRLLESPASIELLNKMADAALEEDRRGETIDLDELLR
jgi:hypothetical protein